MNLYASTACIPDNHNFLETVERLQSAGIDQIEVGSSHRYFPNQNVDSLQSYSSQFLVHNYFPPVADPFVLNLASPDERTRQQSIDHIKRAIRLSADLKAPFYSFHAGFVTDPSGFGTTSYIFPAPESEAEVKAALSRFVSALEEVDQVAQPLGIRLLVENNVCPPDLKGKLLLQTATEFDVLFERLESKNIGLLLDFGHLNVTAATFGFDRMTFIERVADHIGAFHLHDNDGTADQHQPPAIDSWTLQVLRQPKFADTSVVVEARFETTRKLNDCMIWLEANLRA